jgi:hypothetical protein
MGEKLMTAQVDLLVVIFDDPQQANKILPELKRLRKKGTPLRSSPTPSGSSFLADFSQ